MVLLAKARRRCRRLQIAYDLVWEVGYCVRIWTLSKDQISHFGQTCFLAVTWTYLQGLRLGDRVLDASIYQVKLLFLATMPR